MKTILRIIMILLVASAVAGAIVFAVNNGSTALRADEGGQPPAMTGTDGQSIAMQRPEGDDHEGGSITQGLSGVLASLMKLAGITLFVLLLQKVFSLIGNRRLMSAR